MSNFPTSGRVGPKPGGHTLMADATRRGRDAAVTNRLWAKVLRGAVLAGVCAGLVLGGAPAGAAPAISAVDFTGIVALSNCSGSVVRTPNAVSTDRALVMSNGHCF